LFFLLLFRHDFSRVQQEDAKQPTGRLGRPDLRFGKRAGNQRQRSAVVEMGVGEQDRVYSSYLGGARQVWQPVSGRTTHPNPPVDEDTAVGRFHQQTTGADFIGATEEVKFNGVNATKTPSFVKPERMVLDL
jgi:hypothetical protein